MKIFALLLFIALTACGTQKQIVTDYASLYGKKWSLRKIHSTTNIEEVNTKAFIKFDKEKSSAGGNGSCNNFGSNFTIAVDTVSFTNIFSTKMYCEEVQKIENSYLKNLGKVNRLVIKDKELLMYEGKKLLLEFVAEP